ncbi:MAG: hypothetical protein BWY04_01191 [candidate division CPR1 bacterium ADurb.Bin160]|uniref:Uncharacterized protein n=1 Tax=candidate division CPR1 bacterium ADurb.Bin160 TaxID=1852826 RepID=A0A1V5ZKS6_9BACT|nr:MAG: hypothetical protein BWY04_01191 [candidate division CPR1 bacterium ADurb.Bin160]
MFHTLEIKLTATGLPVLCIFFIKPSFVNFNAFISSVILSKTKIILSEIALIASKFFNHSKVSIFATIFIFHLFCSLKNDFNSKISSGLLTPDKAIICIPYSNHRKISFLSLSVKTPKSIGLFKNLTLSNCKSVHHSNTLQFMLSSATISLTSTKISLCSNLIFAPTHNSHNF